MEGVLNRTITGLKQDQENRRKDHPELALQLEQFVLKIEALKNLNPSFTMVLTRIYVIVLIRVGILEFLFFSFPGRFYEITTKGGVPNYPSQEILS